MQCLFASRISRTFALVLALSTACFSSIPPTPSCGMVGRGGEGTPNAPTASGDMATDAPEGAADVR